MRIALEKPRDVGEIFLTLARATFRILRRPYLSAQHVLHLGDRQSESEDIAWPCIINECEVAGIPLKVDAKIGFRRSQYIPKQ